MSGEFKNLNFSTLFNELGEIWNYSLGELEKIEKYK